MYGVCEFHHVFSLLRGHALSPHLYHNQTLVHIIELCHVTEMRQRAIVVSWGGAWTEETCFAIL